MAGNGDIYVSFGAETDELEAAFALSKAEVASWQKQLTAAAKEMQATGQTIDSELGQHFVELGNHLAEAKEHMGEFGEKLRAQKEDAHEGGEAISELKERFMQLLEVVGIEMSVEAFKDWVAETTEAAEKIEQMSAKLGVSKSEIQSLASVAKLAGADFDSMALQLEKLQLNLAKTSSATSPAAAALKALGIDLAEFRSSSIPAQLDTMAEAFSRFADGPTKTAAAMALLGKSGADMIPFLDKGKEGLDELNSVAQRTGVIMSGETVEAFARTREDLNELSLAWTGFSQRLFDVVNPAIDAAIKELSSLLEHADPSLIRAKISELSQILVTIGAEIAKFAVSAREAWDKLIADIAGSVAPVMNAANAIDGALQKVLSFGKTSAEFKYEMQTGYANLFNKLGVISDDTAAKWKGTAASTYDAAKAGADAFGDLDTAGYSSLFTIQEIDDHAKATKETLNKLFEAPKTGGELAEGAKAAAEEVAKAAKPQVPMMDIGNAGAKGARDALQAQLATLNEEVKAYEDAARQEQKALDDKLTHHQISVGEWLDQSRQSLAKELEEVQATYAKELSIAGLKANDIAKIKAAEADAIRKINNQLIDDERKAADETMKSWESAAQTIQGAFNSQLRGLLEGTTTWKQAMGKIFEDLTIKIIEEVERQVVHWVIGEATKTTATVTGNEARTAADAAGASVGLGMQAASILKSIFGSGAETFAGVFGFLSPIMGPAAAGPAAASQAAVLATAGAVASADIGMWQVPGDQLAMIHHNELVMPAGQAAAFRQMLTSNAGGGASGGGSGAGGGITLNVQAMDAASFTNFLNKNGAVLAKALNNATRMNPSLRAATP